MDLNIEQEKRLYFSVTLELNDRSIYESEVYINLYNEDNNYIYFKGQNINFSVYVTSEDIAYDPESKQLIYKDISKLDLNFSCGEDGIVLTEDQLAIAKSKKPVKMTFERLDLINSNQFYL